jgi:hypothetical protein
MEKGHFRRFMDRWILFGALCICIGCSRESAGLQEIFFDENAELRADLRAIAETASEEDNPVLCLVTF